MTKTKIIALALVAVLMVGGVIGGSYAWIIDKTDTVSNVFEAGNINIDLTETDNSYKIVPGTSQAKDPTVTVEAGSEAAWIFVEVTEDNGAEGFISYEIADDWTQLEVDGAPVDGVYYRQYDGTGAASYPVLEGNTISYPDEILKESLDTLKDKPSEELPQLNFTAYAIQSAQFATAADAWDAIVTLGD